jgi:hypothetical protein
MDWDSELFVVLALAWSLDKGCIQKEAPIRTVEGEERVAKPGHGHQEDPRFA